MLSDWLCQAQFLSHMDGLVQDCSHSIADALELLQSCTKTSICHDVDYWNEMFWSSLIMIFQCIKEKNKTKLNISAHKELIDVYDINAAWLWDHVLPWYNVYEKLRPVTSHLSDEAE